IRAAAALLADYARDADFTAALRIYGGDSFAYSVERALARGVDGRDEHGARIVIAARPSTLPRGLSSTSQAAGYTGAEWIPAYSGNYQTANRGLADVKAIVIHDTEGSYAGTVSWFKDPAASVSAHYVVRSSDGHIAQMVDEKNIAYHVKCFNTSSVGIEHEGYAAQPEQWFTEAMYSESAKLTAYLADKYSIAKEHSTTAIMGHGEAPDCSDHTDPGPGWNWPHYIDLVKTGGAASFLAEDISVDAPDSLVSGEVGTVTVTISNTGTAAWDLDATRIGTADPQDRDSAFFVEGDWIGPNRATAVDAQTPAGSPGTFTFQIQAPEVAATTVYDEAFSFVQEDVTWFGPTFHVLVQVKPDTAAEPTPENSGCSIGGSGSGGIACMLALGGTLRRRRRR
ncbi:MAG: N-acetylmuramoyl-L-alanine amidase, partial [Kofleriaceae bacterium]|nr:N-acetylmuramoyl-L-alanine amidase [Kofleriaceae bacterium]